MKSKIGRNNPCPCGSGKKFKRCCFLYPSQETAGSNKTEVLREVVDGSQVFTVNWDQRIPPEVFFDTNVWRSMNQADIESLLALQKNRGFRYRYSITNYVELVSHLEDASSQSMPNPFRIIRAAFRKMVRLCEPAVLPSPEMEFLSAAKLGHYLDSVWIPNIQQTGMAVELIANAESLSELTSKSSVNGEPGSVPRWIIEPAHYRMLRETDARSMALAMRQLPKASKPILQGFTEKLTAWFLTLASFFLLKRPSFNRVGVRDLSHDERNRFVGAFAKGGGKLFAEHCKHVAEMTLLARKKIDPNDLYDMLQLLLLSDSNRFFVTDEKSFFRYTGVSQDKRVIPWRGFRVSR